MDNSDRYIAGNLKPSKVFLDANFMSKLSTSGIFHLIPQSEYSLNKTGMCNKSNPNFTSWYSDQEHPETRNSYTHFDSGLKEPHPIPSYFACPVLQFYGGGGEDEEGVLKVSGAEGGKKMKNEKKKKRWLWRGVEIFEVWLLVMPFFFSFLFFMVWFRFDFRW
ncbi:hypothetical protein OIU79_026115 [Salix purpurea]|uniref:Transmembrane protein n=1 Tax=Salix purpurea TaxID=77065 RepID=A0A9Q1A012_SALPP|nr:hypothetical protein OIU79_026115 [Salix purpurea]